MKSINDLAIWDKDALMAWVFDMHEKIFDMKLRIAEGLPLENPPESDDRDTQAKE